LSLSEVSCGLRGGRAAAAAGAGDLAGVGTEAEATVIAAFPVGARGGSGSTAFSGAGVDGFAGVDEVAIFAGLTGVGAEAEAAVTAALPVDARGGSGSGAFAGAGVDGFAGVGGVTIFVGLAGWIRGDSDDAAAS
jgi:hypothetical protein